MRTPNTGEQLLVDFSDQANGYRELFQPSEPVVHCADIIDDFVDITGALGRKDLRFRREQVLQGALRSFDLTR
jgi:hypothetical protein